LAVVQTENEGHVVMASGVFVLKDKDNLVPMEAAQFALEADFQSLLAKFPQLLPGDQIDPSSPRKWILVRREMPIPSEEDGRAWRHSV